VAPDVNKIAVFNKGTSNGLIGTIPTGGHCDPSSIPGDNELWKKAQKKEKKNITSEVINRSIPHFRPLCTTYV
jgi:L-serine deaminase